MAGLTQAEIGRLFELLNDELRQTEAPLSLKERSPTRSATSSARRAMVQ